MTPIVSSINSKVTSGMTPLVSSMNSKAVSEVTTLLQLSSLLVRRDKQTVLVILDSNHTRDHVAQELALYAPLVTKESYLVVFDTIIEDLPEDFFPDRPWGKGNNPKTAVREFLKTTDRFVIDEEYNSKLVITAAPEGYLRCVRD